MTDYGLDTSKYPAHSDVHGKNGIFLASVASLSLLSVTSRHRDFHSHNSISIHNSRVLARHIPCLPEQRVLSFSHGTRVTVRDLFGSMPVRVKHRALQAERSNFGRDWDRLLLDLVALMIPWPGAMTISIREASSRHPVVLRAGSQPHAWLNDACRLLHQASICDSPDITDWVAVGASSPTLSISGYVRREPVATKRVQFISLGIEPMSNQSRCNVLYEEVNRVFAESSFGTVEGDDHLDEMFKRERDEFTKRELKVTKGVDRWPMFFLKMTPSPTFSRGLLDVDEIVDDCHPNLPLIIDLLKAMFYEFLRKDHCRPKKVVLSTKSSLRKQKDPVKDAMTKGFESTGSSPRSSVMHNSLSSRPSDGPIRKAARLETSQIEPASPLTTCSKVKSGRTLNTFQKSAQAISQARSGSTTPVQRSRSNTPGSILSDHSRHLTAEPSRPPLFDANGKLTRKPFDDYDPRDVITGNTTKESEPADQPVVSPNKPLQDETLQSIDLATNMAIAVDSRNGFTLPPKPLTLSRRASCSEDNRATAHMETRETTPWIRDLISKWTNPVFESVEAPIPKLPDLFETLGLDVKAVGHDCNHGYEALNVGTRHETTAMNLQGRLTRDALRKAQLIAQVDRKFIFARLPFDTVDGVSKEGAMAQPSVLVLVDQHAADERCRVEGLMQGYFEPISDDAGLQYWTAVTENLPKPVQFELSALDKEVLSECQRYFAYWGIVYAVNSEELERQHGGQQGRLTTRNTKAKVSVHRLPPAILERCRTEPRLLAELIRKEAWRIRDEDGPTEPPRPKRVSAKKRDVEAPVWVSLFHGCPQGIVELINSRSCRSKIFVLTF